MRLTLKSLRQLIREVYKDGLQDDNWSWLRDQPELAVADDMMREVGYIDDTVLDKMKHSQFRRERDWFKLLVKATKDSRASVRNVALHAWQNSRVAPDAMIDAIDISDKDAIKIVYDITKSIIDRDSQGHSFDVESETGGLVAWDSGINASDLHVYQDVVQLARDYITGVMGQNEPAVVGYDLENLESRDQHYYIFKYALECIKNVNNRQRNKTGNWYSLIVLFNEVFKPPVVLTQGEICEIIIRHIPNPTPAA